MTSFADPGSGGGNRNANVVVSADVSQYSQGIRTADAQTRGFIGTLDQLTQKMSSVNRRAQGGLTGFSKADIATMTGLTAAAATFQQQLAPLNATAAVTNRNFGDMKKSIENAFTSVPVSRTELVQLSQTLTQLGVTAPRDLEGLLKTYEKLSAATGEGVFGLASGLQQLNRMMVNAGPDQVAKYADTLLVLSKNAGVSATAVLDFSNSIAPLGRQLGLSTEQTMALSTAFVKAGQDGFVAANLFNGMVDDISQSMRTGSPELLKYANLVGLTVSQFKHLPAAEKVTDIVNAISRGGAAAQQFAAAMGYGPRQMSAITALAQSGQLAAQLQTAAGVSGTSDLEKGSKAAFSGLADSLVTFRNEMTQMATAIGTTFLTPMTKAIDTVDMLASALRHTVGPFAGFIGGAMAAAAPVAALGGLAMHAAGLVGALALGRMLFRSTGMAAFSLGRARANGVPPEEYTPAQTRAAQAEAAGTMRGYQTRLLGYGEKSVAAQERIFGSEMSGVSPGQAFRMGLIAPSRVAGYLFRDSTNFYADAMRNDFERRGLNYGQGGGIRGIMTNLRASAARGYGAIPEEAGVAARSGLRYLGSVLGTGSRMAIRGVGGLLDRVSAGHPIENAQAAFARSMTVSATEAAAAGRASVGFGAEVRAAGAAVGSFTSSMVKATLVTTARAGGGLIGAGAGALVSGVGALGRGLGAALSSPWSLPAIIGGTLLYQRAQSMSEQRRAITESDSFYTPVKKYNDVLGIATTNLSEFNSGLTENSEINRRLRGVTDQTSMLSASRFTAADVSAAAGGKVVDDNLKNIAGSGAAGLTAYFQSLGISDPRTLKYVGSQAISAGFSQSDVNTAAASVLQGTKFSPKLGTMIGQAANQSGTGFERAGDFARSTQHYANYLNPLHYIPGIGGAISGAQNKVFDFFGIGTPESKSAIGLRGAYVGQIQRDFDTASQKNGSAYASQLKFVESTKAIAAIAVQGGKSLDEAAQAAVDLYGGSVDQYKSALSKLSGKKLNGDTFYAAANAITGAPAGAYYAQSLRKQGGTTDYYNFSQTLDQLKSGRTSAVEQAWMKQGDYGRFLIGNKAFGAATSGSRSEDPNVIIKAVRTTADRFIEIGKQSSEAKTQLGKFTDGLSAAAMAIQRAQVGLSPEGKAYQLLSAAGTEIERRQNIAIAQSGRVAGFGVVVNRLAQARTMAAMSPTTPEAADKLTQRQTEYDQAEEDQRQFLIQMIQMVRQYEVQQTRMEQDYDHSRLLANRDFHISMEHAERDFRISQVRAQQDFNLQMERQNEAAAQAIYNPFVRIQAQYTASAATTVENLKEQNAAIDAQVANLHKLKRMGLSQAAIDTLNLADPSNAQQVTRLVGDMVANPNLINQINDEINRRLKSTKSLTQSPLSLAFRQAVEDFSKSSRRAVADFDRARNDAVHEHERQMQELAYQFHKVTDRSQQDIAMSLRQYTGSYQHLLQSFKSDITSVGGAAARILGNQLEGINSKIQNANRDLRRSRKLVRQIGSSGGGGATPDEMRDFSTQMRVAPVLRWSDVLNIAGGDEVSMTQLKNFFEQNPKLRKKVVDYPKGFAEGGIALTPQVRSFAETNPELAIPLNARGHNYLAEMYRSISKELVRGMGVSNHGIMPTGGTTVYDHSTEISGPITVVADSPRKMLEALEAKKRLDRLTRPARASGSAA